MTIAVVRQRDGSWLLLEIHPAVINCDTPEPQSEEPLCVAENMSYAEALDAFAANHPEHMDQLDELRDEWEFVYGVEKREKQPRAGRSRKRGSGARFRELILAGKTNEECLAAVRAEFPESRATLSDAAWNRAMLRRDPSGL